MISGIGAAALRIAQEVGGIVLLVAAYLLYTGGLLPELPTGRVLLALIIGGQLLGLLGLIIAIPAAVLDPSPNAGSAIRIVPRMPTASPTATPREGARRVVGEQALDAERHVLQAAGRIQARLNASGLTGRPGLVEAGGEGDHAVARHYAVSGLDASESAQGGGLADRAAGVGAGGGGHHAGRNGGGAAARRKGPQSGQTPESRSLGLSDLALRLGDRRVGLPDALSPLAVRRTGSYTNYSSP